jgi:transposase
MRKRRRFPPEFKAKVVLEVLGGARSPAEAFRKHALSPNLLGLGKATFLERASMRFPSDEQRDADQARIAELEPLRGRATRPSEVLNNAATPRDAAATRNGRCSIASRRMTRSASRARPGTSTAATSTTNPGRRRTGRSKRP